MYSRTSPQLSELVVHLTYYIFISFVSFYMHLFSFYVFSKKNKKHCLNNISKSNIQSRIVLFHVHFFLSFYGFLGKTIKNLFFSIMYDILIPLHAVFFLSIVSQQKNYKQSCFNKFQYSIGQSNIHLATQAIAALIIAFYLLHLISLQEQCNMGY